MSGALSVFYVPCHSDLTLVDLRLLWLLSLGRFFHGNSIVPEVQRYLAICELNDQEKEKRPYGSFSPDIGSPVDVVLYFSS